MIKWLLIFLPFFSFAQSGTFNRIQIKGQVVNKISDDATLAEGSHTSLPTEYAVKNYAEAKLGNPGTNGYVLSSTTGGVRSWVSSALDMAIDRIWGGLHTFNNGYIKIGDHFVGDNSMLFLPTTPGLGLRYDAGGVTIGSSTGTRVYHYLTDNYALFSTQSSGVDLSASIPASAVLEARSVTRGFLPPRLTTIQRDAIGSPIEGLQIYNTTTKANNLFDGTAWVAVGGGSSGWGLTGNAGTVAGTNFIGTTDAVNLQLKVNNVISGKIERATPYHTSYGYNTIPAAATGQYNSAFGFESLKTLSSGIANTALGYSALSLLTTGGNNTAVGSNALSMSNGTGSTALGANSLMNSTTGQYNTAIGGNALLNVVSGQSSVAVGYGALQNNTSGENVAVGASAMTGNTSGYWNTGMGYQVMGANLSGIQNTAIGRMALGSNTGSNNTAIGESAGTSNTSGASNVFLGRLSGAGVTAGSNKLYIHNAGTSSTIYGDMSTGQVQINSASTPAITASAQFEVISTTRGLLPPRMTTAQMDAMASPVAGLQVYNTTANSTYTFNGTGWMSSTNPFATDISVNGLTVGEGNGSFAGNTAFGISALAAGTSNSENTGIGYQALMAANAAGGSSGAANTAVGYRALASTTTGISNTAVGHNALWQNTTGTFNTAMGLGALNANLIGGQNTAVGYTALNSNTASLNTAVGYQALRLNTSGSQNTAVGWNALGANTSANYNTAIGYISLQLVTTGQYNTGLGYYAGSAITTGTGNTFVGVASGYTSSGAASYNTFVGHQDGATGITTGSNNTLIGAKITGLSPTLANNIVIADGQGNQRINVNSTGSVGFGTGATIAASAKVEVISTTQGFLPPRMTATQASAIASPAEGLLVYVTDTDGTFLAKGWWGWDGAAWQKLNN